MGCGARLPGFEFQVCNVIAGWFKANYLNSKHSFSLWGKNKKIHFLIEEVDDEA